ncbi:hypothetical protein [Microvirga sp. TS319]|uniref:hypothetical protein n=1 Tax=Microvirga sp. TS319 TaxID=3241165 RepID=UPI003519E455
MPADKHRSLARRTAYLRLAAHSGFAVQIKWGYAVTPDVLALVQRGHLRRTRNSAGGRKRITCMEVTPSGRKFLQDTLARRGQDFGPVSLIRDLDPRKIRKEEKRRAAGYVSPRVYTGIRHLDAAIAAQHLRRIRRAMAFPGSYLTGSTATA